MTPYFLLYNDVEGYYDTLKKMCTFLEKYAFYRVKFARKVIMFMGSLRLEKMAL